MLFLLASRQSQILQSACQHWPWASSPVYVQASNRGSRLILLKAARRPAKTKFAHGSCFLAHTAHTSSTDIPSRRCPKRLPRRSRPESYDRLHHLVGHGRPRCQADQSSLSLSCCKKAAALRTLCKSLILWTCCRLDPSARSNKPRMFLASIALRSCLRLQTGASPSNEPSVIFDPAMKSRCRTWRICALVVNTN